MNYHVIIVKVVVVLFILGFINGCYCERPSVVKVGAVFTFDSVIGRVAKTTLEMAVLDINADPTILNGIEFKLLMEDAECSVFMGSIRALQVLEKEVMAIIGPQSSEIAHTLSEIASGLKVPLISYAATDPALSALQFPFFVRSTQSDSHQMAAIADLIDFYGWKEVIAVFVDNDYGRNGISALDNELEKKMIKFSHRLALPTEFNITHITELLIKSKMVGPRVYVIYVDPDPSFRIFQIADKLQMMTSNYVWLTTNWFSLSLDSLPWLNQTAVLPILQGVVGLRQYIPESIRKKGLMFRWRQMHRKGLVTTELNRYGLYAYDTVWAVARALDELLKESNDLTFSSKDKLFDTKATKLQLEKLKAFDGGNLLLLKLLQTNFTGLTGQIIFDSERNLVSTGYDVININKTTVRKVGYWSKYSGLSVLPPKSFNGKNSNHSRYGRKLQNVTWPGGMTKRPRGWAVSHDETPLRIGVPYRASFVELVTEMHGSRKIEGYCIDVFNEARKLVPYDVPCVFEAFGSGQSNPNYDALVQMVANGVFDAAVGDIAVVTNRTRIVDFTQPYASTGLVVVAPTGHSKPSAWVFIKPFTLEMWCVTAGSFIMIGVVIWILEHRVNSDFRGPPTRQFITMFMFSFSTLFKTNQEETISPLGRMVMVVWLFVLMVITSAYTASLTSILTVQQLSSPITGVDILITSNVPIGYQVGSYAYGYLTESLFIPPSKLFALSSPEEYASALRKGPSNGGVAAIIDELPYVELFLSKHSEFAIVGQPFTRSGWGFAFPRDSPLAIDVSNAILKLSENGKLQKIRDKWFCKGGCADERIQQSESSPLHFMSFWGLYLLFSVFGVVALLIYLLRTIMQFMRHKREHINASSPSSSPSSGTRCSQSIFYYFNFIDKKEDNFKKVFTL